MMQPRRSILARLGHDIATWLFRLPFVQRRWARRYRALASDDIPWTPLNKPLAKCRVALVTTAGVHLISDLPFDMADPRGDPSYRILPSGVSPAELMITHDYYDHRDADRDINVVLPVKILRQLQTEGRIGGIAPRFYSLMGHIEEPHVQTLLRHSAPEIANRLREDAVDVALFMPA